MQGNYTAGALNAVPGIFALPATFQGQKVNLLQYFNGHLQSSNRGGDCGVSINFLDGGGATPLMDDKPANCGSCKQKSMFCRRSQVPQLMSAAGPFSNVCISSLLYCSAAVSTARPKTFSVVLTVGFRLRVHHASLPARTDVNIRRHVQHSQIHGSQRSRGRLLHSASRAIRLVIWRHRQRRRRHQEPSDHPLRTTMSATRQRA